MSRPGAAEPHSGRDGGRVVVVDRAQVQQSRTLNKWYRRRTLNKEQHDWVANDRWESARARARENKVRVLRRGCVCVASKAEVGFRPRPVRQHKHGYVG